jgi:hypothetical protein
MPVGGEAAREKKQRERERIGEKREAGGRKEREGEGPIRRPERGGVNGSR